MNQPAQKPSFFQTLPGLLTALATFISALVAAYMALQHKSNQVVSPAVSTISVPASQSTPTLATSLPQANSNSSVPVDGNNQNATNVSGVNIQPNISGKWVNNDGYLKILNSGNEISFEDYNAYNQLVGSGSGRINNREVFLQGVNTALGESINFEAHLQLNGNEQTLSGILYTSLGTETAIYFNRY